MVPQKALCRTIRVPWLGFLTNGCFGSMPLNVNISKLRSPSPPLPFRLEQVNNETSHMSALKYRDFLTTRARVIFHGRLRCAKTARWLTVQSSFANFATFSGKPKKIPTQSHAFVSLQGLVRYNTRQWVIHFSPATLTNEGKIKTVLYIHLRRTKTTEGKNHM